MIGRYAVKKFVVITSVIALSLLGCQFPSVQKLIINACLSDNVKLEFCESNGFFPFDFSIGGIKINCPDFSISIGNLNVTLSAKLFKIRRLLIDRLTVVAPKNSKLTPADFLILQPLVVQRVVKSAKVEELVVAGETFHNTSIDYNSKTGHHDLKTLFRFGKLSASWQFENGRIHGVVKLNEDNVHATYEPKKRHLKISYAGMILDGVINDDSFSGAFASGSFSPAVVITAEAELLKINFSDNRYKLSGKIDYNLDKSMLHVHDVSFADLARVSSFVIDSSFRVSDFSILLKSGKVDVSGLNLSSGDNFSLGRCRISSVDLSQFSFPCLNGIVNGTGRYDASTEKLTLGVTSLSFNDITLPNLDVDAALSRDKLSFSIGFDLLGKKHNIKLDVKSSNWGVTMDFPISLKTVGTIDIGDLKVSSGQRIRGKILYNLQASGTLANPVLDGSLVLKNGMYVNLNTGTYIRDISLNSQLSKKSLDIKKIYLRDDSKKGGTVIGRGKIKYTGEKLETGIELAIDKFKIVDQKWLDASLFGSVNLSGDLLDKVVVNGKLYSENPTIDVSGLVLMSMQSTNIIPKTPKISKHIPPFSVKFPVDISLQMKPDLSIHGFGFSSFWDASINVSGDLFDPRYSARATLKKGKLALTDNAFKLKKGSILIDNDNSDISVSAEKVVDNVVVGAKFQQRNDISNVVPYSDPYMPTKDILSYMLFDKNASEISMGEGVGLLGVTNKLSGGVDLDILGKMKTILGIDTISIKKNKNSEGEEYDSISLGKKLGKFKVSVDQATGKDGTNVVVEADVARNTKVSVDLSSKDSLGGGVLWSRRY